LVLRGSLRTFHGARRVTSDSSKNVPSEASIGHFQSGAPSPLPPPASARRNRSPLPPLNTPRLFASTAALEATNTHKKTSFFIEGIVNPPSPSAGRTVLKIHNTRARDTRAKQKKKKISSASSDELPVQN